jgi:hypothetical protein
MILAATVVIIFNPLIVILQLNQQQIEPIDIPNTTDYVTLLSIQMKNPKETLVDGTFLINYKKFLTKITRKKNKIYCDGFI